MTERTVRTSRDELHGGLDLVSGSHHRLVLASDLRFLRGRDLGGPPPAAASAGATGGDANAGAPAPAAPTGDSALVSTRVVSPLEASVVGRLHRYGKRPRDGDLVTIEADSGSGTRVEVRGPAASVTLDLQAAPGALRTTKKLLCWHGAAGDLGGAAWDDVELLDVTAAGSGEVPFAETVTARCGDAEAQLGLLDVLAEDPEQAGTFRTVRYGLFRTRRPRLRFVVPLLDRTRVKVWLDDGDETTHDELEITALAQVERPVTPWEPPGHIALDSSPITATLNGAVGRTRLVPADDPGLPAEGECALFLYGENRIRLELDVGGEPEPLFYGHAFNYVSDTETVPSGHFEIETPAHGVPVMKGALMLDFADAIDDATISRTLHALQLRPRGFAAAYNLVQAQVHGDANADALGTLLDEILGYADPALTSATLVPVMQTGSGETGVLERVPEALHGAFGAGAVPPAPNTFGAPPVPAGGAVAAGFPPARDLHWHHFVIHTFAAHRLIEAVLFPQERPPTVALTGLTFETAKTFVRPGAADSIRRALEVDAQTGGRRMAIFGHTDRVGTDASNEQLSQFRARAVEALLRQNAGFWYDRFATPTEALSTGIADLQWALTELGDYAGPLDGVRNAALDAAVQQLKGRHALTGASVDLRTRRAAADELRTRIGATGAALHDERAWGTREIQEMLTRLGDYTGPINGVNTAATQTAVRALQTRRHLSVDGDVGIATRIVLIRDYQDSLVPDHPGGVPRDHFHGDVPANPDADAVWGCGEAFPRVPYPPGVEASEPNRRVEIVFRRTAPVPIVRGLLGAAVPYAEWRAPEAPEGTPATPPNVVVAHGDSGFGVGNGVLPAPAAGPPPPAGPPEPLYTGDQATQPNRFLIKGERMVRPTNVTLNAALSVGQETVRPDGDLSQVGDLVSNAGGSGHGTASLTLMAADGVGAPAPPLGAPPGAAPLPRDANNLVLGTGPHIKVRPVVALGGPLETVRVFEVVAGDPDVFVYSASVHWPVFMQVPPAPLVHPAAVSAQQQRAIQTAAQHCLMQGKLMVLTAGNYLHNQNNVTPGTPGFPTIGTINFYDTARSSWALLAPSRNAPRANNTGANVTMQQVVLVGAMARVGGPDPNGLAAFGSLDATINNPGQPEIICDFSLIGPQVGIHAPGQDIRALRATPAAMALTNQQPVGDGMTIGGFGGTSAATPLTAGLVGELLMLDPALRQPANIARTLEYLEATADWMLPIPPGGGETIPPGVGFPAPTGLIARSGDPLIAPGPATHAAFINIRRVNFWKAVLAVLNDGLSQEDNRTIPNGAGGTVASPFTMCTLRDDAATRWYGFEVRVAFADCMLWLRKTSGELVAVEDAGALLPGDRVAATAWRLTNAYRGPAPAAPVPAGVDPAGPLLPAFPFALPFPAGVTPFYLCQLSIERTRLADYRELVATLPGVDPAAPDGASAPPVFVLPVDDRAALRTPAAAGRPAALTALVAGFDDFVFHVQATPSAAPADVRFFLPDNRTGAAVGELLTVSVFCVDALGNVTNPPAAGVNVTVAPGPGAGGAPNVQLDGAAVPAGGTPVAFGGGANPPYRGTFTFQGNTAEVVVLGAAGFAHTRNVNVAAPGALHGFDVEIRRAAGGASLTTTPARVRETQTGGDLAALELLVRAVDVDGVTITNFTGLVDLALLAGEMGSEDGGSAAGAGTTARRGVHVKEHEAAPFDATRFHYTYTTAGATPDRGVHAFPFFSYTAGPLRFRVASGGVEGQSEEIQVRGGGVATFLIHTSSPQTAGTAFNVTVTALDAAGNVAEDFEGPVLLGLAQGTAAAVGPQGQPVGVYIGNTQVAGDDTYTFAHTDEGVHVFPVTCHTAETVQFTATHNPPAGGAAIAATGQNVVVQGPGALAQFLFETRGLDTASPHAGAEFELRVIAADAAGHRLTTYVHTVAAGPVPGGNVTLGLTPNPAGGTFGTAFTMGPPRRGVQIATQPQTAGGVLGNTIAFTGADRGVVSFWVTAHTSELAQLRATNFDPAGPNFSSDSAQFNFATGGGPAQLGVAAPTPVVHGVVFAVTVTAQDAAGNRTGSFLGTVNLTLAAVGGGAAPALGGVTSQIFVAASAGQLVYNVSIPSAGTFRLTAGDGNLTGTSANVVVT